MRRVNDNVTVQLVDAASGSPAAPPITCHNTFTSVGADWLKQLVSWSVIDSVGGDVPVLTKRVRWMGVGIGSQPEVLGVLSLVSPVLCDGANYRQDAGPFDRPVVTSIRWSQTLGAGAELEGVSVTEAALYVDYNDAADIDPSVQYPAVDPEANVFVRPVSYVVFPGSGILIPVNKALLLSWELRFS